MKRILVFVLSIMILSHCKKDSIQENVLSTDTNSEYASHRRCQSDQRMINLYKEAPAYKQEIQDGRLKIQDESMHAEIRSDQSILTIPVHIIIVHKPGEAVGRGSNVNNQRVNDQIKRLNLDFRKRNTDVSKTPAIFSTSDSRIEFCLASQDPQGNPTNGITRYAFRGNFDNNEIQIKSATGWDHKRYLNIWVAESIDGLGYAYLPSPQSLPEADIDGVVVLTSTFGDGPGLEPSFNKGRTATHEVGHYLGLDHIWGNGCRIDDGINDTPKQEDFNEGCPSHPSPSCGNNGDMFMNYMDYADDKCMFAFTDGQTNYMRHILSTSRSNLVKHGALICGSGNTDPGTSTCSDGVQNGDETGIDCGGKCKPCDTETSYVDLAITEFSVLQEGCNGKASPTITVKNVGENAVNNFQVTVTRNDRIVLTKTFSKTLLPNAKIGLSLDEINLVSGNNRIKVKITLSADNNTTNNTAIKNVTQTGFNMQIIIQPDDYAADIFWELWNDDSDELVVEGDNYSDFDLTRIKEKLCLEDGCYTFIIYDLYGDGLCCDYGRGWYKIKDANNELIAESNGRYAYYDFQSFCISNGQTSIYKLQRKEFSRKIKPLEKRDIVKYSKSQ